MSARVQQTRCFQSGVLQCPGKPMGSVEKCKKQQQQKFYFEFDIRLFDISVSLNSEIMRFITVILYLICLLNAIV